MYDIRERKNVRNMDCDSTESIVRVNICDLVIRSQSEYLDERVCARRRPAQSVSALARIELCRRRDECRERVAEGAASVALQHVHQILTHIHNFS